MATSLYKISLGDATRTHMLKAWSPKPVGTQLPVTPRYKNLPNPYQSIFGVSDHLYFF